MRNFSINTILAMILMSISYGALESAPFANALGINQQPDEDRFAVIVVKIANSSDTVYACFKVPKPTEPRYCRFSGKMVVDEYNLAMAENISKLYESILKEGRQPTPNDLAYIQSNIISVHSELQKNIGTNRDFYHTASDLLMREHCKFEALTYIRKWSFAQKHRMDKEFLHTWQDSHGFHHIINEPYRNIYLRSNATESDYMEYQDEARAMRAHLSKLAGDVPNSDKILSLIEWNDMLMELYAIVLSYHFKLQPTPEVDD